MRKNRAVSNTGNSRNFVYFVNRAVTMPKPDPIRNAPPNIPTKFPKALKKALALKPSFVFLAYDSTELKYNSIQIFVI